jgi:hypothetical protein
MAIKISVEEHKVVVSDYPSISFFKVGVHTEKTVWAETFATRELLDSFIRGVRAGAAAAGDFMVEVEGLV